MPGGRPTKFKGKETIDKAREYITGGFVGAGDEIPSAIGLADFLEVSTRTVYDWGEKFSHILAECLAQQEKTLINKGLNGGFNSAITKLVLGKHGYHEKIDNTQAGPGGEPLFLSPTERKARMASILEGAKKRP